MRFGNLRFTVASTGWGDPQVLAQRIAELVRNHAPPTAAVIDEITGIASRREQSSPPVSQHSSQPKRVKTLNLEEPVAYLRFFPETSTSSALPGAPKPQSADFFYRSAKKGEWPWVAHRTRGSLVGPERASPQLVTNVAEVFGEDIRRIARCKYPSYLTLTMAADLYEF